MLYACLSDSLGGGGSMAEDGVGTGTDVSCLIAGSSETLSSTGLSTATTGGLVDPTFDSAGASSFLLLPRGAGSSGVRQYVTVRVTTCRTLTLPGLPLTSGSASTAE
jgi:hypothetical protein